MRAEKAYEASKNKIRRFIRWPVADPERICVETSIGLGIIVDYSRTGFSLFTESKLATDQLVNIIFTGDADFEETLKVAGVKNFLGEVKWSRPSEGRFLSGFYLANLTSDQRDSLFKAMRKVFSIKRESK